jgi:hypothetical protein
MCKTILLCRHEHIYYCYYSFRLSLDWVGKRSAPSSYRMRKQARQSLPVGEWQRLHSVLPTHFSDVDRFSQRGQWGSPEKELLLVEAATDAHLLVVQSRFFGSCTAAPSPSCWFRV